MKVRHALCTSLMAMAAIAGSASTASAVPSTCANREAILVGSTENYSIAASSTYYFATQLYANRSYAFLVWTPFEDAGEGGGNVGLTIYSDASTCASSVAASNIEGIEPWANIASADIDAVAYRPTSSGQYTLAIANGETRSVSHRIVVVETTLFSPWWYVGSPNQSFITIANTTSSNLTAQVRIIGNTGTVCATVTPTIAANGNTYIRVNDYPSCVSAGYGAAQITALATPGALTANTTVIDSVGGVSFDEPFTPRAVWGFSVTER